MPIFRQKNQDFFKTWTPEMAYVLGFFAADGSMTKNKRGGHFIEFTSKDKLLLLAVRDALSSEHKISISHPARSEECYRLQIGSKVLFLDLINLGFHPKKSLRLSMPRIPRIYLPDFVRGYFDGDGSVWSGLIHKERTKKTKSIQTLFTSGNALFLRKLELALRPVIGSGRIFYHGNAYRLRYSIRASLFLYEFMYNNPTLYLPRKRYIFEAFKATRL